MDFHKKIRSQISRAAAMAMNLDSMARNDEYINSESDPGSKAGIIRKEPGKDTVLSLGDTNTHTSSISMEVAMGQSNETTFEMKRDKSPSPSSAFMNYRDEDGDDDDYESDPIMNMIARHKTSIHAPVIPSSEPLDSNTSTTTKDPNRFFKAMEARAAIKQHTILLDTPESSFSIPTTKTTTTLGESQTQTSDKMPSSLGIIEKVEWVKSHILQPSILKGEILSRITPALKLNSYTTSDLNQKNIHEDDEEAMIRTKQQEPIIISSNSFLRPEETRELIRLQAATASTSNATRSCICNNHLLLFFYFIQDKVIQYRFIAILGLFLLFMYVVKGFVSYQNSWSDE